MRTLAVLALASLLLSGCVTVPDAVDPASLVDAAVEIALGGGAAVVHSVGAQAGLSKLHHAEGEDVTVTFPPGVLVQDAEGRLLPADGPVTVKAGEALHYLPPYAAASLRVALAAAGETREVDLPLASDQRLVSGDLAVELMKVQRERFPHKTPGHENYGKAIAYFAEEFKALGYEVEVNEYPDVVKVPAAFQPGPASLSSVVAYKRGTVTPERFVVFGGHFDVVEQTTEGAFDNTAGAVATLALATAFRNVTTEHTLVFAAWGGEEDGIIGSNAWVTTHPELVPFIDAYVNFDVTPLAWPAPANDPAPVVVAAGPDGVATAALHAVHQEVAKTWMQTDAQFVYEGVAQGQATGAGVNAQSDHTPFMARGVPVYFPFTSRVDDVFALIHSERDTLDNMTKYAYGGIDAVDTELTPEEMAEGERVLARSFETQMVFGFYYAVLLDAGVFDVARPGAAVPALDL